MYGAAHLPTDVLKGDYMINLDHEDTYSLCIGCQGGSEFAVVNKFERVDVEGLSAQMTINIENGAGGHSGHMVRKKVINAINMMFEILALVSDKYKFAIISAEGGVARNVIAPMCKVEIAINPSDYEGIKKEFEKFFGDFKTEFTEREQKLSLDISQNELTQKPASLEYTQKIINAFNTVIMGVYALSETYPISEGSIN
ncbi:MAG: peptidase dimerization domain-containing protein [Mycoplasmoidaceae bacterium]|nr:peptidase dimerization domain-containing protein [Mycoplasmoidaceae bacterium]